MPMKKTKRSSPRAFLAAFTVVASIASVQAAGGDAARGQRTFGACAACHSLQPDQNMTGPSLSGLWNRKAGGLQSFRRYSPALKAADVVWNDQTLDAWIADPQHLIPGNQMTFQGMKNAQQRADLLAFLKQATQPGSTHTAQQGGGMVPNLRKLDAGDRVQTIRYCGDTYRVTTADGKTHTFWERNLRLKTECPMCFHQARLFPWALDAQCAGSVTHWMSRIHPEHKDEAQLCASLSDRRGSRPPLRRRAKRA